MKNITKINEFNQEVFSSQITSLNAENMITRLFVIMFYLGCERFETVLKNTFIKKDAENIILAINEIIRSIK